MALIRERDGKRLHVKSKLMGESLVGKTFMDSLKVAPQERLFPDVNIHRTDVGTLIAADLIGARSCIFVKDEKGLCTEDPKNNPKASFIPEIRIKVLLKKDLDDLNVERPASTFCRQARSSTKFRSPGKSNITKALAGKHVGTVIYK